MAGDERMLTPLLAVSEVLAQSSRYGEVPGPPVVRLIYDLAIPVVGGMLAVLLFYVLGSSDDDRNAWVGSPPRVVLAIVLVALPGNVVEEAASTWTAELTDGSWGTLEAVVSIVAVALLGATAMQFLFRYLERQR